MNQRHIFVSLWIYEGDAETNFAAIIIGKKHEVYIK